MVYFRAGFLVSKSVPFICVQFISSILLPCCIHLVFAAVGNFCLRHSLSVYIPADIRLPLMSNQNIQTVPVVVRLILSSRS